MKSSTLPAQTFGAEKPGAASALFSNAQLVQELLCRDEIGSTKTLGEAIVDRLKASGGVIGAGFMAQQPGEARRRAQLP